MRDSLETAALRVSAPARLHLGFIDLNGEIGRLFGSIGLAVEAPSTEIVVRRATSDRAEGQEADRVIAAIQRLRQSFPLSGGFDVRVERAIPAHAGLGSGTQLALAIATATMTLSGIESPLEVLGASTQRGRRSAIGIGAFGHGGFIVDGGRGRGDEPPPVLIRLPFPSHWRAILVLDPQGTGVHGDRETTAFATLPPMPRATAAHLSHLVLMQAAPAVAEEDLASFGAAIAEIQEIVGAHFAAAQGGSAWSSPAVGRIVERLREGGATGQGQSSWGPTGFAFVECEKDASALYHSLVGDAKALGLELMVVAGRNTGGRLETIRAEIMANKEENP